MQVTIHTRGRQPYRLKGTSGINTLAPGNQRRGAFSNLLERQQYRFPLQPKLPHLDLPSTRQNGHERNLNHGDRETSNKQLTVREKAVQIPVSHTLPQERRNGQWPSAKIFRVRL